MTEENKIPEIIYIDHNDLKYLNNMKDILGWSYIEKVFISVKEGCLTHESYILKSKYDELEEEIKLRNNYYEDKIEMLQRIYNTESSRADELEKELKELKFCKCNDSQMIVNNTCIRCSKDVEK